MATPRTQEQIYEKFARWVPRWFFENEEFQVAVNQGLAKLWATVEERVHESFDTTFITKATGEDLDRHGQERDCPRNKFEEDSTYAVRVQRLEGISDPVTIKEIVDGIIFRGECIVQEHKEDGPYAGVGCGTFASRSKVLADEKHNIFTIVIPKQVYPPYNYVNRSTFAGAGCGSFVSSKNAAPIARVLAILNSAIAEAKASGVAFRIVEVDH